MQNKLLLIGNGKMGSAFIELLYSDFQITVVSPNSKPKLDTSYFTSLDQVTETFDFVIFAVKPWILALVMPHLKKHLYTLDTVFVSIITGASVSYFKQQIGPDAKIVRVMPNLPVKIGKGISAVFPEIKVDFLKKMGRVIYVNEEQDINRFTALTGSGSGYVFALLEMYQNAALKLDIKTEFDQREIVIDLFEGAIALLKDTKLSFSDQKSKVVVPNGTTFEGLKALDLCGPFIEQSLVNAFVKANQIGEQTMADLNKSNL